VVEQAFPSMISLLIGLLALVGIHSKFDKMLELTYKIYKYESNTVFYWVKNTIIMIIIIIIFIILIIISKIYQNITKVIALARRRAEIVIIAWTSISLID
jgi:hypothetical protein